MFLRARDIGCARNRCDDCVAAAAAIAGSLAFAIHGQCVVPTLVRDAPDFFGVCLRDFGRSGSRMETILR
jgi:hypothetical protein